MARVVSSSGEPERTIAGPGRRVGSHEIPGRRALRRPYPAYPLRRTSTPPAQLRLKRAALPPVRANCLNREAKPRRPGARAERFPARAALRRCHKSSTQLPPGQQDGVGITSGQGPSRQQPQGSPPAQSFWRQFCSLTFSVSVASQFPTPPLPSQQHDGASATGPKSPITSPIMVTSSTVWMSNEWTWALSDWS
jgi:hypothetical protein